MKSNKNLQQLIDVISALSPSEIDVAKKHLSAYNSNHTIRTNKMFQLFHLIAFKKLRDYEKLKKKISNSSDVRSFNRLINRTLDRVEESLIVDVNLSRGRNMNNIFAKRFDSQKKLIRANLLLSKGLNKRSLEIVEKVIYTTSKFELYDELIEAYLIKIRIGTLGETTVKISAVKSKVISIERERIGLRDMRFLMQEYTGEISGKSNLDFIKDKLSHYISKMKLICENIQSNNALSILFLANMEYFSMINSYDQVITTGSKLLKILNNSKAVYSLNRIIYVYNEIAGAYLSLHNFNLGIKYANLSLNLLKTKNNQFLTTIEPFVKSKYYQSNYEGVKVILEEVLKLNITKNNVLWFAKYSYYEANNFFAMQDFKTSFSIFNNLSELEKDKEGWNVWFRIMRILCSIELMRMSLIDYDIESFRKFIQRTDKSGNIRERDKLILKVLLDLDRNNYDFKLTYENRKEEFSKLESTNSPYSWDINSPEMIIFTEWFKAKIKSKKYSHSHFFDNGEI